MTPAEFAKLIPISANVGCHCQGDKLCGQHGAIALVIQQAQDDVVSNLDAAAVETITRLHQAEQRITELEQQLADTRTALRSREE